MRSELKKEMNKFEAGIKNLTYIRLTPFWRQSGLVAVSVIAPRNYGERSIWRATAKIKTAVISRIYRRRK